MENRNNPTRVTLFKLSCLALALFVGLISDSLTGLFPFLTIISTLACLALFLLSPANEKRAAGKQKMDTWPIIDPSVEDVRKAIRVYSEKLPKGVYRTILVKDDNSIDVEQLAPFLKGIPSRKFYMSRETYDIFSEEDKEIAKTLDKVQKAVDLYVKEHQEYPLLPYDPLNRVNYYQLLQAHCLDAQPEIELYITNYDGLVTHINPKKNSTVN